MSTPRAAIAVLLAAAGLACGAHEPRALLRETFYADGSPWTSAFLKQGRSDGEARTWWPGGRLRSRATYVDGELGGPFRSWYADGTPREDAAYRAGRLHGARRAWYPNGAPESEGEFADGRRTGTWVFRDRGGAAWVTREYEPTTGRLVAQSLLLAESGRTLNCRFEGVLVSLRVEAQDGSPRRIGSLRYGEREGTWRRWNDAGALVLEDTWRAGVRHGDWSAWSASGELLATGRFEAGEREGPWWFRAADGGIDPRQSGSYHLGERVGELPPALASPFATSE